MEEFTVKNWNVFGTHWVAIEVYRMTKPAEEGEEERYYYNPAITICIDDFSTAGEPPNEDDQKVITFSLDRFFTESKVAAIFAFQYIKELFVKLSVNVYVFDENHELLEEFDLNSFVEQEV